MILYFMILLLFRVIIYFLTCSYFRKAGPYRARRGAGTSIFGAYFSKKTRIFTTYSTVPASGTARRDPPRHGDLDAQILVKKGLM